MAEKESKICNADFCLLLLSSKISLVLFDLFSSSSLEEQMEVKRKTWKGAAKSYTPLRTTNKW